MTLSIAWVRRVANTEELVVATDSRLRFGRAWDCCPKILFPPRSDCLICFAGATRYAYPLMLQMNAAIDVYPKSRDRAMDLEDMKGHALRVFNNMLQSIHDRPRREMEPEHPEADFLLGGYSWRRREFLIWTLHYDQSISRFTFRPATPWRGVDGERKIMFAGDEIDEAKSRLIELLRQKGKLTSGGFDLEPFEVLRDMIRDEVSPQIGGAPQIAKVYMHMNALPFGVHWPVRGSGRTVLGRPLLDYEAPNCPMVDPDSLEVLWE